jgi:Uma2 family endonuclease
MAAGTIIPVAEYLNTSYDPDREYVNGVLLERNVGEREHSRLQALLSAYLVTREKQWGIHTYTEQRIQVRPTQFRIPDLCAVLGPEPEERVFREPPFLCIEILSREDRVVDMQEKIRDYLNFGVRYVWVINPLTLQADVHTPEGSREVKDGVPRTENPDITVPLASLFS